MMQSDLMEFERKTRRIYTMDDISDQEIRKIVTSMSGRIIHPEKIRNIIVDIYDLYLDDHDIRSLGRRIGIICNMLYNEGKLEYYSKNSHHKLFRVK